MKKITNLLLISMLLVTTLATAQYGIGTTDPSSTAVLDINSSSKGILLPRMTKTQRDAIINPANGLMIFNTTTNSINVYVNNYWFNMNTSTYDFPTPVNDECTGAITITTGTPINGTINGATSTVDGENLFTCFNSADDIWYKIIVPSTGKVTLTTEAGATLSASSIRLSAYIGSCSGLFQVGCSEVNFGFLELDGLNSGQTLYIRLAGYTGDEVHHGNFILKSISPLAAPNYDDCTNAITLPTPSSTLATPTYAEYNVNGATNSTGNTECDDPELSYLNRKDVWFTVTANSVATHVLLKNALTNSLSNLNLTVYMGSNCTGLTEVVCTKNEGGWSFSSESGLKYYIRVWGELDSFINNKFLIAVTNNVNIADNCNSVPLTLGAVPSARTLFAASYKPDASSTITFDKEADVWFRVNIPASATNIPKLKIAYTGTTANFSPIFAAVYESNDTTDICDEMTQCEGSSEAITLPNQLINIPITLLNNASTTYIMIRVSATFNPTVPLPFTIQVLSN